ncbi:UNVERIFIED_CONTAM: hypothetical protein PYX00_000120 [Menopon gallinae]|uniref:Coiled-coil domain-containing protein 112 n=1 Tax=Menopon gallinae TaxID=328185 RepID=A0AAW2I993_9NEOP
MSKCKSNPGKITEFAETNPSRNALNHIKSQDPQNIQALMSLESELESNRLKYLNSWTEGIAQIQSQLRNIKSEVRNDFAMEIRDAQYYRVNMFQLEAKISEMKENIKNEMCSLLKEEGELNKELQLTERRVEDWGKPLNSKIFKPVITTAFKIHAQEDKNDPLTEFRKFLQSSGGHYGGWEEQDHLLFLRERRKYGGKPKFLSAVHSILPDISMEEIEAHEDWFKKYELLKNLQKEAITKWRTSKAIIEQPKPVSEQKDTASENKIKNVAYQRDIVERIKEWKRQQQLKKAEQEELYKQEQQCRAEERLRKRELQKAKKLAVQQYKAEKISRIQNELMASQKIKELNAIDEKARKNLLMKAFREQDQQYIERIRMIRMQSASKNKGRFEKLENVKPAIEIVVERDRRRLLQPTHVWSQHCQQQDTIDKSSKVMDLQTIPRLAVPSWRRGLSNI